VSRCPAGGRQRGRGEDGMTLVELLVVMSVMALVSAILLNLLDDTTSLVARASADVQAENDSRLALRTMTQDIRAASPSSIAFTGSTSGACPTSPTPATCLRFTILRSTQANPNCQSVITYGLQTDWVQRTRSDTNCASNVTVSRNLITNVANGSAPLFTYYGADGATLTSSQTAAHAIKVTLKVSYQGGQQAITLTSTLSLRNAR
jgi:prepilin-type N-terminal cleavage/methylation domain-containing protein